MAGRCVGVSPGRSHETDETKRAGATWSAAARSRYVPAIDPALIVRCMSEPSQHAAVQALRAALVA